MALGAQRKDVLRMVIREGTVLSGVGIVIGIVATLGVTRLVSSMIFGLTPYDPATFLAVAAVLLFDSTNLLSARPIASGLPTLPGLRSETMLKGCPLRWSLLPIE
jgi:putative ABC transport system permease protein